jgi:hypothetical protein
MPETSVIASQSTTPKPPTPLARKLVRYILGFGVGVGFGLAPYLGLLDLPLFKPLLALIPESIQNTVIPLSSALMGTAAVVTEFYGGEYVTRARLRRLFKRTLLIAIAAFIVLIVVHSFVVVTIPVLGGKESVSFVVGFARPDKPPCSAEISDAACVKLLTLDTSEIESFWGDKQIRLAKVLLIIIYLLFTGSFGAIIGLIVIRDKVKTKVTTRHAPARS